MVGGAVLIVGMAVVNFSVVDGGGVAVVDFSVVDGGGMAVAMNEKKVEYNMDN